MCAPTCRQSNDFESRGEVLDSFIRESRGLIILGLRWSVQVEGCIGQEYSFPCLTFIPLVSGQVNCPHFDSAYLEV